MSWFTGLNVVEKTVALRLRPIEKRQWHPAVLKHLNIIGGNYPQKK